MTDEEAAVVRTKAISEAKWVLPDGHNIIGEGPEQLLERVLKRMAKLREAEVLLRMVLDHKKAS